MPTSHASVVSFLGDEPGGGAGAEKPAMEDPVAQEFEAYNAPSQASACWLQ